MRTASVLNMSERHESFHEFKRERSNLFDQNLKKVINTENAKATDTEDHKNANGRWMKRAYLGSFFLLIILLIPRFYIMSCYHQYQWLTVAEGMDAAATVDPPNDPAGSWIGKMKKIRGDDALWTTPELHKMWAMCEEETLGIDDDTLNSDGLLKFCRPNKKEVEETCRTSSQHSVQPEPRAFKDVMDMLEANPGVGRTVIHQMRQVDKGIHASFPSTPQFLFTGGLQCPCSVVRFRNFNVLGFMPVYVFVDLAIWLLTISVVVLRCFCMPHRCCEIPTAL